MSRDIENECPVCRDLRRAMERHRAAGHPPVSELMRDADVGLEIRDCRLEGDWSIEL
jgi:hypothetical protein